MRRPQCAALRLGRTFGKGEVHRRHGADDEGSDKKMLGFDVQLARRRGHQGCTNAAAGARIALAVGVMTGLDLAIAMVTGTMRRAGLLVHHDCMGNPDRRLRGAMR